MTDLIATVLDAVSQTSSERQQDSTGCQPSSYGLQFKEKSTEVHSVFIFPFLHNVLFLFQDPVWDTMLHYVTTSP